MKGKRQPGIERVKDILPKSIHALGSAVEQRYLREYVVAHWETIVGKMIATSVEAVRILRDVLWLYSPDAVWRNQIKMMETDICQRVNNFGAPGDRGGASRGGGRWALRPAGGAIARAGAAGGPHGGGDRTGARGVRWRRGR